MKSKSAKEMKEKLEDKWKQEEDFLYKLMKDFPDLFPKGEQGDVCEPICCSSIPCGWNDLVYNLCDYLNRSSKNYRSVRKTDLKSRILFFRDKITAKILVDLSHKILDPYRPFRPKGQKSWIIPKNIQDKVLASWRFKLKQNLSRFNRKYFNYDGYEKVYPPRITITQIKEKFGTLRFYFDGGNEKTQAAVDFAEFLSSKTCQYTGKKGVMCKKRGWYATLSTGQAKKLGYTICND